MLIFPTEAEAKRNQKGLEMVVPVNGVFALMTPTVYQFWKNRPNPCGKNCPDREVGCHPHCPHGYFEWATARKASRMESCKKNGPAHSYTANVKAEKANWRAKHNVKKFRCMSH